MKKPNVAIVHDHLTQEGGAEQVLRQFRRIWPNAPIYTLVYDKAKMGKDFGTADIRESYLAKWPGARRFYRALLPLIPGAFRRFDLSEYDIVVSSASAFAKCVRTGPQTLHFCYCYTPTRYLWSDAERYVDELAYPGFVKALIRLIMPRLRQADLTGAAGVDEFVGISQVVSNRIRRYYHRQAAVVYPPADVERFAPASRRGEYFLVASRLVPYKRVDLTIQAAKRIGALLKVVGSGVDRKRLERLAGSSDSTVEFTGRVSDAERKRLFAHAKAFLNPQEEDFGITTVEALASGVPVVAYDRGGAREILEQGKYGVMFAPQTVEALAAAMRAVERRRFTAKALRRRAERFSSPHFRRELKAAVDRAYQDFTSRTSD